MAVDDSRYDELREKLSRWPVRMPSSDEVISLLKLLYSESELEILLSEAFSAPYQDRVTSEQAADKLGRPKVEVEAHLNDLADRGLLFRIKDVKDGEIYFSLFPILPGIFEFYLVGERDDEARASFAKLFEEYFSGPMVSELGASDYPWVRVLPVEKNLKVDIKLDPTVEILSFEKVSEYIQTSHKIALMNCACRQKSPCEHPDETCMCFDYYADYMVDRGLARYLEEEEAIKVLKGFEKQGLVHTTTNCEKRPQFICNCCTCSCLLMRGLTEFNEPGCFSKSNFEPAWNDDSCNMCEDCISVCPMNAISIDRSNNDSEILVFDKVRCIGCGLCASTCEQVAIDLVKVRAGVPEGNLRDMWQRVERERVR
jgi:Pyruvate/2-oxoacid:ferredoxin oxidoreductase delta subunit